MSIGDWDIFGDIERLRRIGRSAGSSFPARESLGEEAVWAPPVDILDQDDALVLLVDLPGLRREDIDLRIDRDSLTLEGERPRSEPSSGLRLERPVGRFRRSFRIGLPVDPGKATAVYRDGVLRIDLPRAARAGPSRLKVPVE